MTIAATTSHDGDGWAVRLTGVSVRYRVPTERVTTLKERTIRLLQGRPPTYRDFWALEGIDLELRQGEALGIIGRNGAGKSTLLKVISRILRPTRGRVWVRGRVAPMIELGTGFHPELTGRENIFLNGAVLGFSHAEMQAKLDRIIDFSELKDFIDAPLRTYSSGMMVRLGFAVASDVDPDILIIDEVLSVGDEGFREKSRARMNSFRERGVTLLYVTHDLATLSELCDRSLLLDRGRIADAGEVSGVVDSYRRLIADSQVHGTSTPGDPSMGPARGHS